MELHLTSGSLRVFRKAEQLAAKGSQPIRASHLAQALVDESESLAAQWLAAVGVDDAAITAWVAQANDASDAVPPGPVSTGKASAVEAVSTGMFSRYQLVSDGTPVTCLPWSAEVETTLAALVQRLVDVPRPWGIATEHLLLALAAAEHDTAAWLRAKGLDPDKVQHRIAVRYGLAIDPTPLALEEESELDVMSHRPTLDGALPGLGATTPSVPVPVAQPREVTAPGERVSIEVLRTMDAVGNRAREGLRVVEDYVRFFLNDGHLTGLLKQMRHDLAAIMTQFPLGHCLAARDTRGDVGVAATTAREYARETPADVLTANWSRLQESLRSLEEFAKLLRPDLAVLIERLRYSAYTLQKAVASTQTGCQRLASARLYVLLDGRSSEAEFERVILQLVAAGVDIVQLRDKQLDDRQKLARGRRLRALTAGTHTLFVMNDRPDLALLCAADGVHVGQEELTVQDVRAIVGPDMLVGVSTHCIEQARRAVLDGANYIGVGPTFPSLTKRFSEFPGLELARAVAREIRLPAYAIGGIDRDNVRTVCATGIHGVAVSSAIIHAEDPIDTVRAFRRVLFP